MTLSVEECSVNNRYLEINEPTVSVFEEIQGCRGCGEDRGGGRRGACEKVCRGDGGDAWEEDEICEGNNHTFCNAHLMVSNLT